MTNTTSNTTGVSNEGNNKNRNGCHSDRSGNRYSTSNFKRKVEGLSTLGTNKDKCMDLLMIFQKEVHAYVLANYKQSSDISNLIR